MDKRKPSASRAQKELTERYTEKYREHIEEGPSDEL